MFDLRRLASFIAFADTGSFTRAAKALHLSQPALHMQVAKLADELGVSLYVRRGGKLVLTPEGARVAAFAREINESAARFQADLQGLPARAPLVLCAGEGAYLYLLGPALQGLTREPGESLRLLTRDAEGTVRAVRDGEAHVGVFARESGDSAPHLPGGGAALTIAPFTEVGHVLALPQRHALARRRSICIRDLDGIELIAPEKGRPHRAMVDATLRAAGVEADISVEANGWEVMLHFVALGLGAAIVNACCRMPAGVVARALPELPPVRYVVVTRSRSADARVARLALDLRSHAEAWRSAQKAPAFRAPRRRVHG